MLISLARERSRWAWAFAVFVTLLVFLAIIMLRNTYQLRERDSWVTHSNNVLRQLETLTSRSSRLLVRARQRLINPDRFARGEDDTDASLTGLASQIQLLVEDNAEQSRIAQQLLERTRELQSALAAMKDVPFISTLEGMTAIIERPDNLLSQVVATVAEMRDSEEKILQSRTDDSQAIYFTSIVSQLGTTLFAVSAAFTFLYLAQRRYREQVKMVEEKVRQDEQYQFLMQSTSEGLCGVDPLGKCTLINRAGAELLGYTVDDLVGSNFHSKVHAVKADGTDYPHQDCPIHVAIKTGVRCRIDDEVFWHRLGHPIQVEYSAAPWLQHGVASGAVVSFRDIRLRKQAEQRAIEAQNAAEEAKKTAESANSAKSNFLASMSHELRTPLNAVIMYSEMLQEEAIDLDIGHFAKDLNRIHSAGRHLLSLVNGVLDIAKIEAGKMELHLETVPVQSAIADVTETIRSLVAKNNNRLVVQATLKGTMRLDVTKFRQILFNLLSNAAKFTQNGTVTLSVKAIEQGTKKESLLIEVHDTGIGISSDKLEELFRPFAQAEKTTSKDYGGTGLGLAISKQFAELMGGQVGVRSELGKGTSFTVQLPRYLEERPETKVNVTGITEFPDVLIIDDDPDTCAFVMRSLSSDGFNCIAAHDGESGIELANQHLPKLIVLDVLMPKMDGWNVLTRLKSNPLTAEIPVVLLTIETQSELGFSLGAAEYLGKPVTREQLISVARRLGVTKDRSTALVIDDDASTREVLSRMLTREGWLVECASDGQIALDRIKSGNVHPDMILLDLQMPNMDGFDFLTALRKGTVLTQAPIVVLTSRDLSADERIWLAHRVENILQKGGQTQTSLLLTLREVLNRPPVLSSAS